MVEEVQNVCPECSKVNQECVIKVLSRALVRTEVFLNFMGLLSHKRQNLGTRWPIVPRESHNHSKQPPPRRSK